MRFLYKFFGFVAPIPWLKILCLRLQISSLSAPLRPYGQGLDIFRLQQIFLANKGLGLEWLEYLSGKALITL